MHLYIYIDTYAYIYAYMISIYNICLYIYIDMYVSIYMHIYTCKTEWSHNVEVVPSGIEEFYQTVKAIKAGLVSDRARFRSEIRHYRAELTSLRGAKEFLGREQWTSMYGLRVPELEAIIESLRGKVREIQNSLSENDFDNFAPTFDIRLEGKPIGYIPPWKPMTVLGSNITGDARSSRDIKLKIAKAWRAFWSMKHKFCNPLVDASIRIKALEVFIKPLLLYAAGSWTPSKSDLRALLSCHLQMSL